MRAELPWNVAGIPPEAREAARAAARREGLSVGEWLTRRILQSFSGLEDDATATLDSWGLPASTASRRDSEEMLARVGRSEAESNDAWRRIEDQLRGLGRRLESSERTHSESNRVLSRTAQEINLSAREQAQAMEQLGHNIMALAERLERLERGGVNESFKEAVKALHLGLSRLAEQITSTASNSTSQLAQVTANLEKLAGHVGQIWEDADNAAQLLERRIDVSEQDLSQRIANAERTIEARVSAVERTAQFSANALDHALEKIEASAGQRAADQGEIQRLASQQEDNLHRLQDSIARVETLLPGPELDKRLGGVERSVQDLADRFDRNDPAARFDTAMQALSHRLEKVETVPSAAASLEAPLQAIAERLEKLETAPAALDAPIQALSHRLEKLEKDHAELLAGLQAKAPEPPEPATPPASLPSTFDAPPFAEQPQEYEPFELPAHETPADEPPPVTHAEEETGAFTPPPATHVEEEIETFTPVHALDVPPQTHQDAAQEESFTPDFEDVFDETPRHEPYFEEAGTEPENFLAQARRSARAASEKAENEGRGRLSAFRWNPNEAASEAPAEEKEKPRYLIPILVALLVVAAAAAALVLSQRAKLPASVPAPKLASTVSKGPAASPPAPPKNIETQLAPQAESPAGLPSSGNAQDFSSQRSEPAASDVPPAALAISKPASQGAPSAVTPPAAASGPQKATSAQSAPSAPVAKNVTPATAAPATAKSAPAKAPVAPDRVSKLANAGNPIALTILGLRAVDGTNGVPVNLPDAVKFLTQAAEKGQAVAQYRLGTLYERGQGVAVDGIKAVHWYGLAAAQGNRKAMHNLAVAYASGTGGKRSMAEAARWFAKAAALGLSDSQFNLAVLYERGDGVPQSLVDAYKWYSIAAATGDAESKARMAVLQTQLGDADKAAANRSVTTFHAAPLNRIANVPPEPTDLGN
jgi:localization factor PodJL